MSEMTTTFGIPEVSTEGGIKAESVGLSPEFSGKWEDFSKDIAAMSKEFGNAPNQPAQPEQAFQATATEIAALPPPKAAPSPQKVAQTVVQPVQQVEQVAPPTTAQVAPTPELEVPEKFRGADGKLDQEKLLKSYGDAERALKKAQNQARQSVPQPAEPTPAPAQPIAPNQLSPFELQVAQDLFSGGGYTEQQAISQARVLVKLEEARHQASVAGTLSKVAQFEQVLEEKARKEELESLARSNPWVLTPKGQSELVKVREENPWINASPEPWKAATMYLLGQKTLSNAVTGQVNTPIPTATQQQPLPVMAAQRPQAATPLNTPSDIEAYVKTLDPKQEAEFWRKAGFAWKDTGKQFTGVF